MRVNGPGSRNGEQPVDIGVTDSLQRHGDAFPHSPPAIACERPQSLLDGSLASLRKFAAVTDSAAQNEVLVVGCDQRVEVAVLADVGDRLNKFEVGPRARQPAVSAQIRRPFRTLQAAKRCAVVVAAAHRTIVTNSTSARTSRSGICRMTPLRSSSASRSR
jgi:hypothetical protein